MQQDRRPKSGRVVRNRLQGSLVSVSTQKRIFVRSAEDGLLVSNGHAGGR
jgi:hypothetical protein